MIIQVKSCPSCGHMPVIHYRALDDGQTEAQVACPMGCKWEERYKGFIGDMLIAMTGAASATEEGTHEDHDGSDVQAGGEAGRSSRDD